MEVFAHHLEDLRVPLVVHIPQVGTPDVGSCHQRRQFPTQYFVCK